MVKVTKTILVCCLITSQRTGVAWLLAVTTRGQFHGAAGRTQALEWDPGCHRGFLTWKAGTVLNSGRVLRGRNEMMFCTMCGTAGSEVQSRHPACTHRAASDQHRAPVNGAEELAPSWAPHPGLCSSCIYKKTGADEMESPCTHPTMGHIAPNSIQQFTSSAKMYVNIWKLTVFSIVYLKVT